MKYTTLFSLFSILLSGALLGQVPDLNQNWKFHTGDSAIYSRPDFNDKDWAPIKVNTIWENQGYDGYDGYAWYRIRFVLPSNLREKAFLKDSIRILLGKIDDVDQTFLNGVEIGHTGSMPYDKGGYVTAWDAIRRYTLPLNHPSIHWDAENVIAVRVFDGGGGGGFFGGGCSVDLTDLIDYVKMDVNQEPFAFAPDNQLKKTVFIANSYSSPIEGTLKIKVIRDGTGNVASGEYKKLVIIEPGKTWSDNFLFPNIENAAITYQFEEHKTGKTILARQETPYILTPKEKPEPQITASKAFGAQPGSSFMFHVSATGTRPMHFIETGLPPGLSINELTGDITGVATTRGDYPVTVIASNELGKATSTIKISIGDQISLTPPMGWNSWNCWGISVSEEKVKQSANAFKSRGLMNHGWSYINIDDGWQKDHTADGEIRPNDKFPDMKRLGDYIHAMGLKLGIYSSPGPKTCGNYEGSWKHEEQDAMMYAKWGIDYLKYDWCSYGDIDKKPDLAGYKKPYKVMQAALKKTGRDILYSLCQYGMGDVWKWGHEVGGSVWRTTGDIEDTWESMSVIGFRQNIPATYSQPGRWNDPDMLIVGMVGWGDHLHPTRLTPNEQYTHISLWAMLSAPLLIGCDLSRMDDFTYNLLTNDEVIAIDQDVLGKGALPLVKKETYQIWVKPLADGSKAVAVFNLAEETQKIDMDWSALGIESNKTIRDVWKQQDLGKTEKSFSTEVYRHGVMMLRIY